MSHAYTELAGLLLASENFDDLTQQLAELTARTITGATTCAITAVSDERVLSVAASDALGAQLDEQQYAIDEGPCLEAIRTRQVVSAPDLATETRWHDYPAQVLARGISAVHSAPLLVRGRALGALNVYADAPRSFDTAAQDLIVGLAGVAAVGIAGALAHFDEITLTDHLRRALTTRGVIDQAIGIVVGARRCTPAQAFEILRGVSQTRNIRLHVVAEELVARTAGTSTHLDR